MAYRFKTSAKRSDLMRRIKSNKTKPELLLQGLLRKEKIRFKKNYRFLKGIPDAVIPNKKIAIFVDGEFWHGYNWKEKRNKIKDNRAYWIPKIERTILRDSHNNKLLYKEGWRVIRFWEQQIIRSPLKCIQAIKKLMRQKSK